MAKPETSGGAPQRLSRAARAFVSTEAAGGLVLVAFAILAMAWANSPWHESYTRLWETRLRLSLGNAALEQDLRHWVNEGLMALFFFVVGLEVKREIVQGELRRWRTAALPTFAALGGMVVPALLYTVINAGGPGSRGWGIPMATDVAFALGALALIGRRAHPSLKVFLLTLAVADDIGAIVVIAIFYTGSIEAFWLAAALGLVVVMVALRRGGMRGLGPFVLLGIGLWVTVFNSGLHATLAGVALALLTPARPAEPDEVVRDWARELVEEPTPGDLQELRRVAKEGESLVERLEGALHPWTSFVVIPVFALANSGVRLDGLDLDAEGAAAVAGGAAIALVAGKFAGILLASWLAVRTGVGELPRGVTWRQLAGGAAFAGIGFTVSLFIAGLAFEQAALTEAAKVGVIAGSIVAAAAGWLILAAPRWLRR